MAVYIYSVESFPGTDANGRKADFLQALGHQIILHGGHWTKLAPKYEWPYFTDFQQRGSGPTNKAIAWASKVVTLPEEIAERLTVQHGHRGIVYLQSDPEDNPKRTRDIEAKAKEANTRWREFVIEQYENNRKLRQLTGTGRIVPSLYELECYEVLGLARPGSIDEIKAAKSPTVEVKLPDDLIRLLHDRVADKTVTIPQIETALEAK
jgi:hypothetical protein